MAECEECEPRSGLALGSEYPFSKKRVDLCPVFCVPDYSPEGPGTASPGSVGTVDPEVVDLAFWFRMPFLTNKGQKEEGN